MPRRRDGEFCNHISPLLLQSAQHFAHIDLFTTSMTSGRTLHPQFLPSPLRHVRSDAGSSTVEASGLFVCIALLMAMVGSALPQGGPDHASRVAWKVVNGGASSKTAGGQVTTRVSYDGCVLCADGYAGMRIKRSTNSIVPVVEIKGGINANVVKIEGEASTQISPMRDAQLYAKTRARASIGGNLQGKAKASVTPTSATIDLDGEAFAGAKARAEAKLGAKYAGAAIEQTASAEGWAGFGISRTMKIKVDRRGRAEWKVGGGVAMGLGGKVESEGSVDLSRAKGDFWRALLPLAPKFAADSSATTATIAATEISRRKAR